MARGGRSRALTSGDGLPCAAALAAFANQGAARPPDSCHDRGKGRFRPAPRTLSCRSLCLRAFVAVVLGLPTTGPMLLRALMNEDMYLAGSFVMLLATLTVIGTLISDLLLLAVDPRIRFEAQAR